MTIPLICLSCVVAGLTIDGIRLRLNPPQRGRHAAPGRAPARLIDGRHYRRRPV